MLPDTHAAPGRRRPADAGRRVAAGADPRQLGRQRRRPPLPARDARPVRRRPRHRRLGAGLPQRPGRRVHPQADRGHRGVPRPGAGPQDVPPPSRLGRRLPDPRRAADLHGDQLRRGRRVGDCWCSTTSTPSPRRTSSASRAPACSPPPSPSGPTSGPRPPTGRRRGAAGSGGGPAVHVARRRPLRGQGAVLEKVPPFPAGEVPAMLAPVDMPFVGDPAEPWMGTPPPRDHQHPHRHGRARVRPPGHDRRVRRRPVPHRAGPYVREGRQRPAAEFGLTQAVAALPQKAAGALLVDYRSRDQRLPRPGRQRRHRGAGPRGVRRGRPSRSRPGT